MNELIFETLLSYLWQALEWGRGFIGGLTWRSLFDVKTMLVIAVASTALTAFADVSAKILKVVAVVAWAVVLINLVTILL